ncbi:hypothetical protein Y032_0242g3445 [Ancylostoma ceylanicum]|uniref:Uncharacterized protein n=1 Tax=Ancylostoma ceylanicum TaxID=53326 RepID=A0A016SEE1_9BILA|nr:hypothetical protein Y032_0242g3445 [Ancylostoma ceylanicum]
MGSKLAGNPHISHELSISKHSLGRELITRLLACERASQPLHQNACVSITRQCSSSTTAVTRNSAKIHSVMSVEPLSVSAQHRPHTTAPLKDTHRLP